MAKAKDDLGYERKPDETDKGGTTLFKSREEEEAADRERLKVRASQATPERRSEIMTELANLQTEYEAELARIREEYSKKKQELIGEMGGGPGYNPVPAGPQPTNETLADGSPRVSTKIPNAVASS